MIICKVFELSMKSGLQTYAAMAQDQGFIPSCKNKSNKTCPKKAGSAWWRPRIPLAGSAAALRHFPLQLSWQMYTWHHLCRFEKRAEKLPNILLSFICFAKQTHQNWKETRTEWSLDVPSSRPFEAVDLLPEWSKQQGPHQFWGSSTCRTTPTSSQQRLGGWSDKRWNLPRGARNSGVTKRLGGGHTGPCSPSSHGRSTSSCVTFWRPDLKRLKYVFWVLHWCTWLRRTSTNLMWEQLMIQKYSDNFLPNSYLKNVLK